MTIAYDLEASDREYSLEEQIEDAPITYDEDSSNLVSDFMTHPKGPEELRKIAMRVREDYDNAWSSTEEWRNRQGRDWKMYVGELPPKDFPFEGAANAHIPMTMENLSRLYLRVAGELFGDWSNVATYAPVGPEDTDQAQTLSLHTNWQIQEQIIDFSREQLRGLLMFLGPGDVTCHSYYDYRRRTNRHEMLSPDEFVVPYALTSTAPDWSDVPYYVKVLTKYRNEIEAEEQWYKPERLFSTDPSWESDPPSPLREAANEVMGIVPPSNDSHAPYKLLQYEGWMLLPGQTKQRFVQVIQEYQKSTVLLLKIHEAPDWRERAAYAQRLGELALYEQELTAFDESQSAEGTLRDDIQAKVQSTGSVNMMDRAALNSPAADAPVPPSWFDPEQGMAPIRKSPVYMFSHAVCIEPLVGNLGLGYLRILSELNRAVDTLGSQYIDAGTLANARPILHSTNLQFPNNWKVRPGMNQPIKGVSGREFKDGLHVMDFGGANDQLMQIAKLLMDFGQSSVQAPEVFSGVPGKSGETYRGLAARIEQASKQISVVARRYANPFLTQILRNNAVLNSFFLREDEFVAVTEHRRGSAKRIQVGRRMYERDYNIIVNADLRFTPQAQRIAEADELVAMWMRTPALQTNLAFGWEAIRKALVARNLDDMLVLMPPRPEVPPQMVLPPPPPGQGGQ